ncbi:MAG: cupredoxin domain-containing protein [Dissulfurispiraceae bacterium]
MSSYKKSLAIFLLAIIPMLFTLPTEGAEGVPFIATIEPDGVQRVTVLAGEYFFKPNHIVVKAAVPVEITIKKEPSVAPHDFVIKVPEAGIDILESLSTEPKVIRFTPSKPGSYPFYCDKKLLFFKSHRAQGMEGVLEVRP